VIIEKNDREERESHCHERLAFRGSAGCCGIGSAASQPAAELGHNFPKFMGMWESDLSEELVSGNSHPTVSTSNDQSV
jgi:hypothetical protein